MDGPMLSQAAADTVAEILTICKDDPSLTQVAEEKLEEILARFELADASMTPAGRAQREIDDYLAELRRTKSKDVRPTSVNYRDFSRWAARRYDLPLDPKQTKRKEDIMQWLSEHWDKVRSDLFTFFERGIA
jgi:hypothetical protein